MRRENGSVVGVTNDPTSSVASGVWGTTEQINAQRDGNWPAYITQQQIARSLRFNSADSAYLNRTFSTPTNNKIWTWSGWIKRSALGSSGNIFSAVSSGTAFSGLRLESGNTIYLFDYDGSNFVWNVQTTQLFRDVSAWYHLVLAVDTTQATASNRLKFYVNGSQVTAFSTANYPSQNSNTYVNAAVAHQIGATKSGASVTEYFNGYMTEVHFIDGQALTPSSFGRANETTGVWEPYIYGGTYGTNGFYLKFADNSGATATTLGKDSSSNGNNWTPNNFSVTAGVGNDSLVDTPTPYGTDTGVGGEVRGNYATWNPLASPSVTLTNGNLDQTTSSGAWYSGVSTIATPTTGKWYCEIYGVSVPDPYVMLGVTNVNVNVSSTYVGAVADSYGYYNTGQKYTAASSSSYGASYTTGNTVGIALDMDAGTVTFYKNGVSQGLAFSGLSGQYYIAASTYGGTNAKVSLNAGQRPFDYAAPSGFKALCTQNLLTPTVAQGDDHFNTVLYTGDGTYPRAITGLGFSPSFVWIKARSTTYSNTLYDVVRGTGSTKMISSDLTSAEPAFANNANLSSFDADGFTIGSTASTNVLNNSGTTFVAWNWNAGGSTVTNNGGSVNSQVRANTTAGISIVTYTVPATNTFTVGHGLGVAPSMILAKGRNQAYNWDVYHVSTGATGRLILNSTSAFVTTSGPWANTSPSSTVFSSSGNGVYYNSGDTLVAYCFAAIPGFSAFGSYTGNGSTDGPFVYTGLRPAWVLFKRTSATSSWVIFDAVRNTYNVVDKYLYPDLSLNEQTASAVDLISNGFKLRSTNAEINGSGSTYIYAAFAENPFKYSLAR